MKILPSFFTFHLYTPIKVLWLVAPICQRLHLHEMVTVPCHLYIMWYCSDYSAYFLHLFYLSHHNKSVPIFPVMPKKLSIIGPEVSWSRDGSLQVKGHEGPVSPVFPNVPNWASKMSNHPITYYTPMFWKLLGFKILSTQMAMQSRRFYKDSAHRAHGERGPWWAKHDTAWEEFLLQARMYRGTHGLCVSKNSL